MEDTAVFIPDTQSVGATLSRVHVEDCPQTLLEAQ